MKRSKSIAKTWDSTKNEKSPFRTSKVICSRFGEKRGKHLRYNNAGDEEQRLATMRTPRQQKWSDIPDAFVETRARPIYHQRLESTELKNSKIQIQWYLALLSQTKGEAKTKNNT